MRATLRDVHPRPLVSRLDDDARVLTLAGEIEDAAVPQLVEAIAEGTAHYTRSLDIDLSDLEFIPSSAIGVLAVAMRRAAGSGHSLELVAAEGSIAQQVLKVCAMPHRTA
ncbi:MAG: Anti-anti-sigma factor [Nocardioides sp.]|nr:Anti-anti-sigma factor [Nocardioides sp.]